MKTASTQPAQDNASFSNMDILETIGVSKTLSSLEELLSIQIKEGEKLHLHTIKKIVSKASGIQRRQKIKSTITSEESDNINSKLSTISNADECTDFLYSKMNFLMNRGAFDQIDQIYKKYMELKKQEPVEKRKNDAIQSIKKFVKKPEANNLEEILQTVLDEIRINVANNMNKSDSQEIANLILAKNLKEFSNLNEFIIFFQAHTSDFADYLSDVFDEDSSDFDYKIVIQVIKIIYKKVSEGQDLSGIDEGIKEVLK